MIADLSEGRILFISHASTADGGLALQLAEALKRRGFRCWVAPRDLAPSETWATGCMRGIHGSQSFLLLASQAGLASDNVKDEILQARKAERPIYTVLMPPAKVKGEVDFYLARFHWLTYAGRNAEELSSVLVPVLAGKLEWVEIADGPSFNRTMRYRPVAFAKMVAAVIVALLVMLGPAGYALNVALDRDYRRIGWVDISPSAAARDGKAELHAQVWLMAKGVAFRDVTWVAVSGAGQQSVADWRIPEQVGDMEPAVVTIDSPTAGTAGHVWSCLTVNREGKRWRVTQEFAMRRGDGELRVAEIAKKRVDREDGSACGGAGAK